jgi:hypothetical protein
MAQLHKHQLTNPNKLKPGQVLQLACRLEAIHQRREWLHDNEVHYRYRDDDADGREVGSDDVLGADGRIGKG